VSGFGTSPSKYDKVQCTKLAHRNLGSHKRSQGRLTESMLLRYFGTHEDGASICLYTSSSVTCVSLFLGAQKAKCRVEMALGGSDQSYRSTCVASARSRRPCSFMRHTPAAFPKTRRAFACVRPKYGPGNNYESMIPRAESDMMIVSLPDD